MPWETPFVAPNGSPFREYVGNMETPNAHFIAPLPLDSRQMVICSRCKMAMFGKVPHMGYLGFMVDKRFIKHGLSILVGGFNPSEKYESHLGSLFPVYGKKNMFQSPPTIINHGL